MDNLVLAKENKEIESLSRELGFTRTLFAGKDFLLLSGDTTRGILDGIHAAKKSGKPVLVRALKEEVLRFVLEKTPADIVLGQELIHASDSVHFVRAGLDQVLCTIAHERNKIIAFSLGDILHASNRPQLLARMMLNIKLCKKYRVKMLFSTFARNERELCSAEDLFSLWKVLGGISKESLCLVDIK